MFGILLSALNTVLRFVFGVLAIKTILFTALWLITTGVSVYVVSLIPDASEIRRGAASMGPGALYFMDFFALDVGINAVLSAYGTRFLIRRIPGMG